MAITKSKKATVKRVKPKINPMDKKPKTTASKKKTIKKTAGAGAGYGATSSSKGKKSALSAKTKKG